MGIKLGWSFQFWLKILPWSTSSLFWNYALTSVFCKLVIKVLWVERNTQHFKENLKHYEGTSCVKFPGNFEQILEILLHVPCETKGYRACQWIEDICLDPGVLGAMEGLGALLIMLIVTRNSRLHHLPTLERLQFLEVLTHIKVSVLTIYYLGKSKKLMEKRNTFAKVSSER